MIMFRDPEIDPNAYDFYIWMNDLIRKVKFDSLARVPEHEDLRAIVENEHGKTFCLPLEDVFVGMKGMSRARPIIELAP